MKQSGLQNKRRLTVILIGYFIAVLFITLYRDAGKQKLILTPFWEWKQLAVSSRKLHWILQIGLNILLFVPFGFLMPHLFRRFRSAFVTAAAGFLFSVSIETVQYFAQRGFTETDDILHNTLGACIGYLFFRALHARRVSFTDGSVSSSDANTDPTELEPPPQ